MKKTLALLSVSAVTALAFSGLLSNSTYAAANSSTTINKVENSVQADQTDKNYQIKSVTVLNTKEIKLSGNDLDFLNRSIVIESDNGTYLVASYDKMKDSFVLMNNQSLTPGVHYEVSASWARIPEKEANIRIADLLKATQIAPNQIELVYDRPVDFNSATNPGNYWVVNNQDHAADIANLGKNDAITPTNGLTTDQVKITPEKHSMTAFVMTFKSNASPGVQYKVIPCFVNVKGEKGYMGGNFNYESMLAFVAKDFATNQK